MKSAVTWGAPAHTILNDAKHEKRVRDSRRSESIYESCRVKFGHFSSQNSDYLSP